MKCSLRILLLTRFLLLYSSFYDKSSIRKKKEIRRGLSNEIVGQYDLFAQKFVSHEVADFGALGFTLDDGRGSRILHGLSVASRFEDTVISHEVDDGDDGGGRCHAAVHEPRRVDASTVAHVDVCADHCA